MKSVGTLRLRQDVILGLLSLEHAAAMYRWMCQPVVSQNIGLRDEPSLSKTLSWIRRALHDPLIQPYAVMFNGQHVGNVILDRIDDYLETARLSIYLGDSSVRGKGVGITSIYLALSNGFQKFGLHKVWLTVHANNSNAINSYRSLGFLLEGILRDEFLIGTQRIDLLYFGMLKEDFARIRVSYV